MRVILLVVVFFSVQTFAHAYLGPGLGVGTIAIALGFLGSILLAIFALLYYPFKRMFKKKQKKHNESLKDETKEDEKDSKEK